MGQFTISEMIYIFYLITSIILVILAGIGFGVLAILLWTYLEDKKTNDYEGYK